MDAERNCYRQLKSWHELYQAAVGRTGRDPTPQEITRLAGMFPYLEEAPLWIANHMIGSDTGTGGSDVIEYLGRFKGELFFPELEKALSQWEPGGYIL
jgi:tryptophan 2,3-dioxygenase